MDWASFNITYYDCKTGGGGEKVLPRYQFLQEGENALLDRRQAPFLFHFSQIYSELKVLST